MRQQKGDDALDPLVRQGHRCKFQAGFPGRADAPTVPMRLYRAAVRHRIELATHLVVRGSTASPR